MSSRAWLMVESACAPNSLRSKDSRERLWTDLVTRNVGANQIWFWSVNSLERKWLEPHAKSLGLADLRLRAGRSMFLDSSMEMSQK